MRRIVEAWITPMPKYVFDPMPEVWVKFDTGEKKMLFSYFPDEISFSPGEFIGKTEIDARKFFHQKDVAYLRS